MLNRQAAEANIDELLTYLSQKGCDSSIHAWAQGHENDRAQVEKRAALTISLEEAKRKFRQALLDDPPDPRSGEGQVAESAIALLGELNRPTNRKFSAVDAWRAADESPLNPSPEEKAYLNRQDQQEQRKWEGQLSEERWQRWRELEKARRWPDLYADQARLFEEWFDAHPELHRELAAWLSKVEVDQSEDSPPGYDRSGLFWLTTNIVFQRLGLRGDIVADGVAVALFARFTHFWPAMKAPEELDEKRRAAFDAAFEQAYLDTHRRVSKAGVHAIQQLEHYLVNSAKRILSGGRAVDPQVRKQQRRQKAGKASEGAALADQAESPQSLDDIQRLELEDFIEDKVADPKSLDDIQRLELEDFIHRLPDRQKAVLGPLLADPTLTHEQLAAQLGCSTKHIRNIRKEVRNIWRQSR
jgi:hypothetical protein